MISFSFCSSLTHTWLLCCKSNTTAIKYLVSEECCFAKEKKNVIRSIKTKQLKTKGGVSHFDLAIYIRKYLKAKERES